MDKKELKWYVAPAQEIIELELENTLCLGQASNGDGGKDTDLDLGGGDDDENPYANS